jgi:hypothetical protein
LGKILQLGENQRQLKGEEEEEAAVRDHSTQVGGRSQDLYKEGGARSQGKEGGSRNQTLF